MVSPRLIRFLTVTAKLPPSRYSLDPPPPPPPKVRPGSPQWLIEETTRTRVGLMRLRHNVILLREPSDPDNSFYPRWVGGSVCRLLAREGGVKGNASWGGRADRYVGMGSGVECEVL